MPEVVINETPDDPTLKFPNRTSFGFFDTGKFYNSSASGYIDPILGNRIKPKSNAADFLYTWANLVFNLKTIKIKF